jgi:predicted dehydrogenase
LARLPLITDIGSDRPTEQPIDFPRAQRYCLREPIGLASLHQDPQRNMSIKQKRPLKIGILGCGAIAQAGHFESVTKARNTELFAICDVAEDLLARFAVAHSAKRTYTSYDRMLTDPDVEAVIIATADSFHVSAALAALAAGKHVLCEKPLGVSLEEVEELRQAMLKSECLLQVGHMKRFDPGLQSAKSFVDNEMGEMLAFKGWYCDSTHRYAMTDAVQPLIVRSDAARKPDKDPKQDLKQYFMLAHGCHLIDTARYLCGELVEVNARHLERFGAHC